MKNEIDKAVETFHKIAFCTGKKGRQLITDSQLAALVAFLTEMLMIRYKKVWFPDYPERGSGYRCLRINGQCMDPTISASLKKSKIAITKELRALELTIWVDPGVVSIRIGEEGSIGTEEVEAEPYVPVYRSPVPEVISDDEAYLSRSPSPVYNPHPKPMDITPSKRIAINVNRESVVRNTKLGNPMTKFSRLLPFQQNPPISSSQNLVASGQIPPQYSHPRTLFPRMDVGYADMSIHPTPQQLAAMARQQMSFGMMHAVNNMDITAQA